MYNMTLFGKINFPPIMRPDWAKRGLGRPYMGMYPLFLLVRLFILDGLATFWKVSKKFISNTDHPPPTETEYGPRILEMMLSIN